MTARLLRPFNIDVAHKPMHKFNSYFTAIYMIPCRDCQQKHIGQTSKKIETRITEHKNATYDNCHTFNWKETHLLRRAQTKHAREFIQAWYSTDNNSINRHIDIPTVYLQLKTVRKVATNNDTNINKTNVKNLPTPATRQSNHSTNPDNEVHLSMTTHPSTTNDAISTSEIPIRRSQRIHNLRQQRET